MELLFLLLAFVSMGEADPLRALKLLSRCQPETRFHDVRLLSLRSLSDEETEEQKEFVFKLQGSSRFFATKMT